MKLSKFKFNLPTEQIALYPSKNRDESRLMVVNRKTGTIEHRIFKEILDYFGPKDVFILIILVYFLPVCTVTKRKQGLASKCFCFVN